MNGMLVPFYAQKGTSQVERREIRTGCNLFINIMNQEEKLVQDVSVIAQRLKELHNDAVIAYTPQVQELCAKKTTQNEVERMLDRLLMYAGDERMLKLYKQVCRAYWKIYPKTIAYYIMAYRKEYDRESLIGTEYEYLLHEDEIDEE